MKNFIWQYIDIDSKSISDMQERFINRLNGRTPPHFFQYLDLGITHFLDLEIIPPVLIRVKPNYFAAIHKDFRTKCTLAINLPLLNCENSITEFWEVDPEAPVIKRLTPNFVPYNEIDPTRCKKIDEYKLTSPIIFDTSVPHSVHNFSDQDRLAISIRFKEDPWHLVK